MDLLWFIPFQWNLGIFTYMDAIKSQSTLSETNIAPENYGFL